MPYSIQEHAICVTFQLMLIVVPEKIWSSNLVKTQNWNIGSTYTWTISVNIQLFWFCRQKNPDFMQTGFVWTKFGQVLPHVLVNLKKSGQKWQRQKIHLLIGAWKTAISRPIFNVKTTCTPPRTPNKAMNRTCLLQLGATSNPIWNIGRRRQKTPIFAPLGPKVATKSLIWAKRQQDKVLRKCPGGRVPIFSGFYRKSFEIVKNYPQLPNYKCSAGFSITLAQGPYPSSRFYFIGKTRPSSKSDANIFSIKIWKVEQLVYHR